MSEQRPAEWLGLDIGGANLKGSHTAGQALSIPFEVWKRPQDLAWQLGRLGALLPPAEHVAVTMTAELCDCYATRAEGVSSILEAVKQGFPGREIRVWGSDQRFHTCQEAKDRPMLVASANWLALAALAARLLPEGPSILIDIGTTSTDLVPLRDGRVVAQGRTDFDRLRLGELVYAGVRRTPLMAVATELPFRGQPIGLAAELFASTLDIYLVLGEIASDPTDDSTADGRPATARAAVDRLARMLLCDPSEFSAEDAKALAEEADKALIGRLGSAARRACEATSGAPVAAIVVGSGSFLARRLARRLLEPGRPIVDLGEAWGAERSVAGCAFAVMTLAAETAGEGLP